MNKFEDILKKVIFILFLLLSINCILQVALRYVFGYSFRWSLEISRYLMIYMVFICIGPAYKRNLLPGISSIEERLPINHRKNLKVCKNIIMIIFAFIVIKISLNVVLIQLDLKQLSSTLQIPMGFIYFAIPLGFAIYIIFMVIEILQAFNIVH